MTESPIKESIVNLVESNEGISHHYLQSLLVTEYLNLTINQIVQAIGEAAQNGLIKRIEFTPPKRSWYVQSFYIPAGSSLVI